MLNFFLFPVVNDQSIPATSFLQSQLKVRYNNFLLPPYALRLAPSLPPHPNSKILVSPMSPIIAVWHCVERKYHSLSLKPKFHLARHVTTQHAIIMDHSFWLCRACRAAGLDTLDTSNVSCRVET